MLNEPKQKPGNRPLAAIPEDNGLLTPTRPPIMESARLFAGGNEVWIEHHGEIYRLQRTKVGKLILTK